MPPPIPSHNNLNHVLSVGSDSLSSRQPTPIPPNTNNIHQTTNPTITTTTTTSSSKNRFPSRSPSFHTRCRAIINILYIPHSVSTLNFSFSPPLTFLSASIFNFLFSPPPHHQQPSHPPTNSPRTLSPLHSHPPTLSHTSHLSPHYLTKHSMQ